MISRYGYSVVGVVGVIVVSGVLLSWFLVRQPVLRISLIAILAVLMAFTLWFFRDPERVTPQGDNLVIAPADGVVIAVKDVTEPEYLKGDGIQVSIFMSPFNVHVNRYPISGKVGFFRHIPGERLMAFDEKSSLRNERTLIGLENGKTKILFKQIAGFIARRIVADVKEGDLAIAGTRFGMIRFGSRVDVILPKGTSVAVKIGDRTAAGETVLAVF